MGTEAMVVGPKRRWDTWEELILGGAVLRHGTEDWNVVASELSTCTLYPFYFTHEVCKAKYEDLRKRHSGRTAWFDELRKRRVAELKKELKKSEDSIGSLESKIESLKTERLCSNQVDCGSSQTESPAPLVRSDGNDSFGKETSKDGLSAGSFTQDTRANWSPEPQIPAVASAPETSLKPKVSEFSDAEKDLAINEASQPSNREGGALRKRRGKRKRKVCSNDVKEGSIGENDNLGSTSVLSNSRCKETSTSDCGQTTWFSGRESPNAGSCQITSDNLMRIFDSVAEDKVAHVFRHRLDGQKRARYKKIIKQHMDFNLIKSRIASCSIKTARELFRDMLLLANNALVFYSKRTREYKSAMALRDIALKEYRQRFRGSYNTATSAPVPMRSMYNPPVKPRSARPRPSQHNAPAKVQHAEDAVATPYAFLKRIDPDSNVPLQSWVLLKKGLKHPTKVKGWFTDGKESLKHLVKVKSGFTDDKKGLKRPEMVKSEFTDGKEGSKRPVKVKNGLALARVQDKSPGMNDKKGGRQG